jgi:pyruvate formate lyase activating enzyme
VDVCLAGARQVIGRKVTVKEVLNEIEKDIVFYDQSGGGATFSGGEPLMQTDFLYYLLFACQKSGIHTAVDTTCFAELETLEKISKVTDLFLCDLKHMDSDIHQRFTGVPNNLILDNIKWLASSGKKIFIRLPVVPGFNDSQDNIEQTVQFASTLDSIAGIDLLPYNSGGQEKASRLTQKYEIMKIQPPSPEQMADIAGRIEGFGFEVKIGG